MMLDTIPGVKRPRHAQRLVEQRDERSAMKQASEPPQRVNRNKATGIR